ncbi:MAG: hypothetical protein H6978_05470 [Gammaproteobacteria bacterium]|nr:hypothetical protein [Gammaproteobacteria bacterium]
MRVHFISQWNSHVHSAAICVLAIACALFAGCSEHTEADASPYPIQMAGIVAARGPLYWVDDRRVIFVGYKGREKPSLSADRETISATLYLWDTESNEVNVYADEYKGGLCVFEGEVRYLARMERFEENGESMLRRTFIAGPVDAPAPEEIVTYFFHERQRIADEEAGYRPRSKVPRIGQCGAFMVRPESAQDEYVVALKEGFGYLVLGSVATGFDDKAPESYLVNGDARTPISFLGRISISGGMRYLPWANAYFTHARSYPLGEKWEASGCLEAYQFDMRGLLETTCIPSGPYSLNGGKLEVEKVKAGYIISSAQLTHEGMGSSGLYYIVRGEVLQIDNGYVYEINVSPSGCQVAFTTVKRRNAYTVPIRMDSQLAMIDLCIQGRIRNGRIENAEGVGR